MIKKICSKCKTEKTVEDFGKLLTSKDGLRYDCKMCRQKYREAYKASIRAAKRKEKCQRETYVDTLEIAPIKKNKEKMTEEKRLTNMDLHIKEVLQGKLGRVFSRQQEYYSKLTGCNLKFLKRWIEYRFTKEMSWDNFGTYWQIDHILPIKAFRFSKQTDKHKNICFHWTNLQPLPIAENIDKIILHQYFNNLVTVHRFNQTFKEYLGYQAIRESLSWLRTELRYGKNPPDAQWAIRSQNPKLAYDKSKDAVQRLNGSGHEGSNQTQ